MRAGLNFAVDSFLRLPGRQLALGGLGGALMRIFHFLGGFRFGFFGCDALGGELFGGR